MLPRQRSYGGRNLKLSDRRSICWIGCALRSTYFWKSYNSIGRITAIQGSCSTKISVISCRLAPGIFRQR